MSNIVNSSEFADGFELESTPAFAPRNVFLSIQPRHAHNILNGTKTVEFRRRFPSGQTLNGATVWIYATAPEKAVVGRATVTSVHQLPISELWSTYQADGGIDRDTFYAYFTGVNDGCAIRLEEVRTLDDEVSSTSLKALGFCVPQSYRYVTDELYSLLKDTGGEIAPRYKRSDRARGSETRSSQRR